MRCGGRFTTYPDLFERALRASTGLLELGVGAGDRIALLLRNSIEFLEASIATVPLGASAVPINWHWRGDEIAHVLTDSGAKALIVHRDLWPAIAASVPEGVQVILVPADGENSQPPDASLPAGAPRWPEWLAGHEPWAQPPEAAPVSIIYTSGTTGRPKGVVRTPATDEQREGTRALLGEIFQLGPGERTVIPAPMYHTAPNVYALVAATHGMDMTIMTTLRPRGVPADRGGASRLGGADGPDDVRAAAVAARGGARTLRAVLAALGRARGRAVPARGQARDDRVAGTDRRRVLRRHRDRAGRVLHERAVARRIREQSAGRSSRP